MPFQSALFETPSVPGLAYHADFLSEREESELIGRFAGLDFQPFEFQQWLGKRRVVYFGWRYDYKDAGLAAAPPIPEFLLPLRVRAAALAGVAPEAFEHALITQYPPGAPIGWHRDRPQFDRVVGISLLAPCTLRLRRRKAGGFERAALRLEPRSAYVLTGAARHDWEHSIVAMETLRYSITFRTMVRKPG